VPQNPRCINGKKLALTMGIKAGKYDFLLFTEAYCNLLLNIGSENWKRIHAGKEVILV
jgi:hypothetical protein